MIMLDIPVLRAARKASTAKAAHKDFPIMGFKGIKM
jgi:hypothetical protein